MTILYISSDRIYKISEIERNIIIICGNFAVLQVCIYIYTNIYIDFILVL